MMSEEAEKEGESAAAEAPESGGGGGNKIVLILTALNFVISAGVIALVWMSFKKQNTPPGIQDVVAHEDAAHGAAEGEHGAAKAEGGHGGGEASPHGEAKGEIPSTQDFGKMIALDQFTVNLINAGSVNPRFIRVNLALEIPSDDTEDEIAQKMPRVRNSIIDLLNSKRPQDLASRQGRDYLKEEIRNTLNSFLVTGKVKGVYITNIAVSS